jgi:serine protease Do
MNRVFRCLVALCCVFLAGLALSAERGPAPFGAGQRTALVIGNGAYPSAPLANPVNDARAVSARLKALGFQVIERENLTVRQIGPVLREFRSRLAPGGVALFFYAGHGLQVQGVNYLTAVDADIASEEDVSLQSLEIGKLLQVMDESKTRLNLVFLDACRNNPYARGFRSAADGLAKVSAPSGTLISFATRPGSVAADGSGRNGLYTEKLLSAMEITDQPIELVLKRVVSGVKAASKGQQEPWIEGSIEGDFCFGICVAPGVAVPMPAFAPLADTSATERAFWDSVKDTRNPDELQAYLKRYPKGAFADLAQARLKALPVAPPVNMPTIAPTKSTPDCARCPEIVARQGPAVVNVTMTQVLPGQPAAKSESKDDLFKQFFGKKNDPPARDIKHRAIAAGFIISPDGYILTAAGIADHPDEITVRLADRREFKARVIGSDKRTGIALIKVEPGGAALPVIRLGSAKQVRVGEQVMAIGSPFGVDNTATVGIVSGTGRVLPKDSVVPYIQTDMTLYPGYGGGPLINMAGEVVGINALITTSGGASAGMAFAIPIDLAMAAEAQLRAHGRVRHGRIGLTLQEVTQELASSLGLPAARGVLVNTVEQGGPAARAGLAAGDVIQAVNAKEVNSSQEIVQIVASTEPGKQISIRFLRNGATMRRMVSVDEAP